MPTYPVGTTPGSGGPIVYCSGSCTGPVTGPVQPWIDYAENVAAEAREVADEVTEQHDWCWTGGATAQRVVGYASCMLGG